MGRVFKYSLIFLLVFIFLFLRFFHLEDNLNFGSDQGKGLLQVLDIYKNKKLTLISSASSLIVFGREIYSGSFLYYFYLPFLILTNWNPITISYLLIFLNLISLLILFLTLEKVERKQAFLFFLLSSFSTTLINYSRFSWAPNFLIPISNLVLALIIKMTYAKSLPMVGKHSANNSYYIFLGLLLGLGLEIHYSYILTIILTTVYLLIFQKKSLVRLIFVFLGFCLGFSPLILFELKHAFYNTRTLFLYLTQALAADQSLINFNQHYLLSLYPFALYLVSYFLVKLTNKLTILSFVLITFYLIFSISRILKIPDSGFLMVKGFNYKLEQEIAEIIIDEDKKNFNIVDIFTGDTRAMAIRYLLTIAGKTPQAVDQYPASDYLFIYSKLPFAEIAKGNLWEITSLSPFELSKNWQLRNGINLYLIERSKLS